MEIDPAWETHRPADSLASAIRSPDMKKIRFAAALGSAILFSTGAYAQSLVEGVYQSGGDANGKGQCTLTVKAITESHKYGDEAFELESSGDGACEWSAIGLSKSYSITAGLITNGGAPAFVKISFPFGPAGKRLEVTTMDTDGTLRNQESFEKLDKVLTGG
jgi:hypothetical protein